MAELPCATPLNISLNRVQIVDLPGLPLDDAVRGRRGYELLSNRALIDLAAPHAAALDLADADLSDQPPWLLQGDVDVRIRVPQAVNAALDSSNGVARMAAQAIANRLGRNLGWLLITLRRGDAANRSVLPDWEPHDWWRWAAIRHVWLGGGISSGRLGEVVAGEAGRLLRELDDAGVEVKVSPFQGNVALIGAGRVAPLAQRGRQQDSVLGFDFGHTLVKRAVLSYEGGRLAAAKFLEPLPVDWHQILPAEPTPMARGRKVLRFLAETIATTAAEHPQARSLAVASVAAHKQQGRLVSKSPYASIHDGSADLAADAIVSAAASTLAGWPMAVRLIHDGTAASLVHAGSSHSVVIMLGTALGVGFPPETDAGLRPLALASCTS